MTMTTDIAPSGLALQSPGLYAIATSVGTAITFTFNAAGDKIAFVFQADGTNVPDLISFVVATYTSTGGVDVTLETLDGNAEPNGAVTGSATVAATVSGTGIANTAAGMAGTASLTGGALYAIVLTATGTPNFTIRLTFGGNGLQGLPFYKTKDSAGAWGAATGGGNSGFNLGFKNTSSYYQVPGYPGAFTAFALINYNNGTNPDERGNRMSFPVPKTVVGALVFISGGGTPGANDDYTVNLVTSHTSGRVNQRSVSLDGNAQAGNQMHSVLFASPYEVSANTVFALTVKADGTEDVNMPAWDYQANGDLAGVYGTGFYSTTANNGGNFTDSTTRVYAVFPLFSQYDDGAGGGGGGGLLTHPGMGGGMRG